MGRKLEHEGVLVSKKGRQAVILTQDGGFRSVKLKRNVHSPVGALIVKADLVRLSLKHLFATILAVGVSVFCLSLNPQSGSEPEQRIAAYVTIGLDAPIETGIDSEARVISVRNGRNMNAFGMKISRAVSFGKFSSEWVNKAEAHGLKQNKLDYLMTISFSGNLTKLQKKRLSQHLIRDFDHAMRPKLQGVPSHAEWMLTTMASRNKAEALDLPVGRYLLYQKAIQKGASLTLAQARQLSPKHLIHLDAAKLPSVEKLDKLQLDIQAARAH